MSSRIEERERVHIRKKPVAERERESIPLFEAQ